MNKDYYWVKFIINGNCYYSIWVSDVKNYFLTYSGNLIYFTHFSDGVSFCEHKRLKICEEVTTYNTDRYIPIIESNIDCIRILDFWNIISDLAMSINAFFEGDDSIYNSLYEKLVLGCNLPALSNGFFLPIWSVDEVTMLNKVLINGIKMLNDQIVHKFPFEQMY